MTFVHPSFLWALLAVAVPVIIHLFNFRRYKKVYFTNVRFLRELQEESRSRSRLRELLILLARCLAIACLVLAFCQPVLPGSDNARPQTGANAVSLYIDNSFSTQNVNARGPVFDVARQKAREVVKAFNGTDRFQIITNDFEGRHQRLLTREDALAAIDELKISPAVRSLDNVVKRQTEFLAGTTAPNKRIFIFSDAQKSTFNLNALQPDTAVRITFVPVLANQVNNVFIDSCWFDTPIQQKGFIQNLHARIRNTGKNRIDIGSARLFLNKQQTAIASFSLEPDEYTDVKFTFECRNEGFNYGRIKIEDYPVTFDDELNFAFNSRINIQVCLVQGKESGAETALDGLFTADSVFSLSRCSEATIDYAKFKTADVLVLNQLSELSSGLVSELQKFCAQGGAVVIVPPFTMSGPSYNACLRNLGLPQLAELDTSLVKTGNVETASGFYDGVFEQKDERMNLPLVTRHYRLIADNKNDFEHILTLLNGDALLGVSKFQNAAVYLLSAPLGAKAGNFARHALFVPTFYKISFGAVKVQPLFFPVSTNVVIDIKSGADKGDQPPHIRQQDGEADIIPELRTANNSLLLYTRGQVSQPGFYEVNENGKALLPLAFNYSRLESDLTCYTEAEIAAVVAQKGWRNVGLLEDTGTDISGKVLEAEGGKKLWKLFILLALGFIVAETALLRFLK